MTRIKSIRATADTNALVSGKGTYYGMRVVPDGTNSALAELHDALTVTGTQFDAVRTPAIDAVGAPWEHGIPFYTGLSLNVTTAGALQVFVFYTDG